MHKILVLVVFLCSAIYVLSSSNLAEANNYDASVRNTMENLTQLTASAVNHLLTELSTKFETTSKTLVADMETVIGSALHQLAQPFEDLQQKVSASQCHPEVQLESLKKQIDSDLSKCTQNIEETFTAFQRDSNAFKMALEKNIKDMIDLPTKCKNLGAESDFNSLLNCYVGNLATLNRQIADILDKANETIIHTCQLGEKALQEGRACTNEMITATKATFNTILSSCSKILEQ